MTEMGVMITPVGVNWEVRVGNEDKLADVVVFELTGIEAFADIVVVLVIGAVAFSSSLHRPNSSWQPAPA